MRAWFTLAMSEFYDVTTPLGQRRCDTEDEVREHIAAYIQTDGASLNRVSVIYVPETGNTTVMGEARSPADFWTPSE
jgi:hypothetical protein